METGWSIRFRYLMMGVVIIAATWFIWYLRLAIAPLVISALIAYVLNPVVDFIYSRTPLPRRISVPIVFFLALGLLITSVSLIVPVVIQEVQRLITDLDVILLRLQELLSQDYIILGQLISLERFVENLAQALPESLAGITLDAFHLIETTTKNLLWALVIMASSYSLLQDWDRLRDWLIKLAPGAYRRDVRRIYEDIKLIWRGYLRGNLALMGVTGVIFTIAWLVMGVPGAIVLGLIAGVLTIIPDLGPAIAAILAILVALVEGSAFIALTNFWFAFLVLVVYLVLNNVTTIWIRPRIFGRSVRMHGSIVFIAIVAAIVIQGVLGALVVIPVIASASVVARYVWKRVLGEEPFPEDAAREEMPPDPIDDQSGA